MERTNSVEFVKIITLPTLMKIPNKLWTEKKKYRLSQIETGPRTVLLSLEGKTVIQLPYKSVPSPLIKQQIPASGFAIFANVLQIYNAELHIFSYEIWANEHVLSLRTPLSSHQFISQRLLCDFIRYSVDHLLQSEVMHKRDIQQELNVRWAREHTYHQRLENKGRHLHGWIRKIDQQALSGENSRQASDPLLKRIPNSALTFDYQLDSLHGYQHRRSDNFWVRQIGGIINNTPFAIQELLRAIISVDKEITEIEATTDCQRRPFLAETTLVIVHEWSFPVWESEFRRHGQSFLCISGRDDYNRIVTRKYAEVDFVMVNTAFLESTYYKSYHKKQFPRALAKSYFNYGKRNITSILDNLCYTLWEERSGLSPAVQTTLDHMPLHIFAWRRVIHWNSIKPIFTSMVYWSIYNDIEHLNVQDVLRHCYGATGNTTVDPSWCWELLASCIFDCKPQVFEPPLKHRIIPKFGIYRQVSLSAFDYEQNLLNNVINHIPLEKRLLFWLNPNLLDLDVLNIRKVNDFILELEQQASPVQIHKEVSEFRHVLHSLLQLNEALDHHTSLDSLVTDYNKIDKMLQLNNPLSSPSPISVPATLTTLLYPQYNWLMKTAESTIQDLKRNVEGFTNNHKRLSYVVGSAKTFESEGATQCPICLQNDAAIIINCGHLFCQPCVAQIYHTSEECPVCKHEITDMTRLVKNNQDVPEITTEYHKTALMMSLQRDVIEDNTKLVIITETHQLVRNVQTLLSRDLINRGYKNITITAWTRALPSLETLLHTDVLITSVKHSLKNLPDHIPNFQRITLLLATDEKLKTGCPEKNAVLVKLIRSCGGTVSITQRCIKTSQEMEELREELGTPA